MRRLRRRRDVNRRLFFSSALLAGLFLAPVLPAQGRRSSGVERQLERQQERERSRERKVTEKEHAAVMQAFASVVGETRQAVVAVRCDGDRVALGTIVDRAGHVLTKASELDGPIECRLASGRVLGAELVGVSQRTDLALLRLTEDEDADEEAEWTAVSWAGEEETPAGSWVITAGLDTKPLAIGVISVTARPMRARGILGIRFSEDSSRARIERVFDDTGAAAAGLRADDVILRIDGTEVTTREDVVALLGGHGPGDRLRLKLRRGEEELELSATLGRQRQNRSPRRRFDPSRLLNGRLSERRADFPQALQHDTWIYPDECGGPLIDLEGRVLGLNIARSGRVDTLALPAAIVREELTRLRSGELPPGTEFIAKLGQEALEARLEELRADEKAAAIRLGKLRAEIESAEAALLEKARRRRI